MSTFETFSTAQAPSAVAVLSILHLPALPNETIGPPAELPRIAGYEILKVLGRGGMGVVYLARQIGLARLVALKTVLAGAYASPEQRERFHTEAQAVARLQHPHIVQIHEIGEADGQPYLSMEYLEGGSLADELNGKPWPWRSATTLVTTLAGAIHHAHQRGIVHRDLKPGNILLQKDEGRRMKDEKERIPLDMSNFSFPFILHPPSLILPKITDFGIAKLLVGGVTQTHSGAILGTPGYMAPEQIGASESVGPAADIHALGAILYELLTGRPPFHAEGMLETLEQIRFQQPVSPRRLTASIPLDLETICLKCLHKDPDRRCQSALDLVEDLRRCVAGEPILARPVSAWERGTRWLRRNPARAGLVAVSFLAVLALAGVLVGMAYSARLKSFNNQLGIAVQRAEDSQAEAEQQRTTVKRMERWVRYLRNVHLADEAWQDGQVRRLSALLEGCPSDLRGWEWNYLHGLAGKDGRSLQHPAGVFTVAFDPSGRRLASGCQDGSVWLWNIATGTSRIASERHTGTVWSVAFSPDGRFLASAGDDRRVRIWDVESGRLVRILRKHGAPLRCLAFSPYGKILAAAGNEGTIKLWGPESGRELTHAARKRRWSLRIGFCSRRPSAGIGRCGQGSAIVGPADRHPAPFLIRAHRRRPRRSIQRRWHGPGICWRGWNIKNLGPIQREVAGDLLPAAKERLSRGRVRPDGRLAAASESRMVYHWEAGLLHTFRGHNHRIQGVAFSPDGKLLASASPDWTVKLWEVNASQESRALPIKSERVLGATFSSDGKCMTDVALDGTVRVGGEERPTPQSMGGRSGEAAGCCFLHRRPPARFSRKEGIDSVLRPDNQDGPSCLSARAPLVQSPLVQTGSGWPPEATTESSRFGIWPAIKSCSRASVTAVRCRQVAFSPDGRSLASGSLDGVRLWNAATGEVLAPLAEESASRCGSSFGPQWTNWQSLRWVATLPFGIATAGSVVPQWLAISAMVWSLAFTPDGRRLASGSRDMTVKLWDIASGQETLTFRGFTSEVSAVAFNPDGDCLVTTDQGGSVRFLGCRSPQMR